MQYNTIWLTSFSSIEDHTHVICRHLARWTISFKLKRGDHVIGTCFPMPFLGIVAVTHLFEHLINLHWSLKCHEIYLWHHICPHIYRKYASAYLPFNKIYRACYRVCTGIFRDLFICLSGLDMNDGSLKWFHINTFYSPVMAKGNFGQRGEGIRGSPYPGAPLLIYKNWYVGIAVVSLRRPSSNTVTERYQAKHKAPLGWVKGATAPCPPLFRCPCYSHTDKPMILYQNSVGYELYIRFRH